jgi:TonB family protein
VDDARKAIEGIVKADPFFRPSDVAASPRVRATFQEVRQPLLPGIAQRMYTEAKASFDRKDPQAGAQFDRVLAILDDPDVKATSIVDLRTLASGFRDLSKAASASEAARLMTPPTAPTPGSLPPAPILATAAPISNPDAAREGDPGVTPPVTVSQPLPLWSPSRPADRQGDFRGTLEITIDEQGEVEAVAMRQSVHALYDAELLKVARSWKFKPATKNGVPVLYVKTVQIHLSPKK